VSNTCTWHLVETELTFIYYMNIPKTYRLELRQH